MQKGIIRVTQLPVIEERLQALKSEIEEKTVRCRRMCRMYKTVLVHIE